MRRSAFVGWVTVCTALAMGALAFWLGQSEGEAQACCRTCPTSERDPRGCCPARFCASAAQEERPRRPAKRERPPRSEAPRRGSSGAACPQGMVRVPGGTFWMGSPAGEGEDRERPQTQVTLSAYCLDRTEVTVGAYLSCVSSGSCTPAAATVNVSRFSEEDARFWSQFCNGSRQDRLEHPVNCVDWGQAEAYCRWRGARLPTEAEWEYASRGPDGRTYPWGNQAPDASRLNAIGAEATPGLQQYGRSWNRRMYDGDDGHPFTAPVGSYPAGASPYGVLDMAGNVWEWTADWYGPYRGGSTSNPQGPDQGRSRVIRGGGWYGVDPSGVRAAYRYGDVPAYRYGNLGFRCARGGS